MKIKNKIFVPLLLALAALLAFAACHGNKDHNTPMLQNEECLICGAPLEYLEQGDTLECVFCKKKVYANVRCTQGHYVCDQCHTSGVDSIIHACLHETSCNPYTVLEHMMAMPFCHMHGPEHHILVGASLLTAYHNAGGEVDLEKALPEMVRRGKEVPGGACGNWGACGAALSTGMFMSIITRNTPLSTDSWRLCNRITANALTDISSHGGPRCCKRDSYLAIGAAVDFVEKELGVKMEQQKVTCTRSQYNNQCIGNQCPFFPKEEN